MLGWMENEQPCRLLSILHGNTDPEEGRDLSRLSAGGRSPLSPLLVFESNWGKGDGIQEVCALQGLRGKCLTLWSDLNGGSFRLCVCVCVCVRCSIGRQGGVVLSS